MILFFVRYIFTHHKHHHTSSDTLASRGRQQYMCMELPHCSRSLTTIDCRPWRPLRQVTLPEMGNFYIQYMFFKHITKKQNVKNKHDLRRF